MTYKNETGMILSGSPYYEGWVPNILKIVEGTPGSVEFEPEDILTFHKDHPGGIYALAHTHPPKMYGLSARDQQTLKTWCWTISPYPMRMITVAQVEESIFKVTTYFGHLESKASWLKRGKEGARQFEIIEEDSYLINLEQYRRIEPWENIIVNKSYTKD